MSTKIYEDLPLSDRFRSIASFGVRNMLISAEKELTLEQAEEAYNDFSKLGLRCVQAKSSNMPVSYLDEDHYTQAIEEVKKLRDILKIYGGRQIELTAGSFRGKKEEHLEAAVKYIAEACDIAAESSMYCALDFTPKKNQLIKTWEDMRVLYEKAGKENLLINVNTALLHHLSVSDDGLDFLDGKSALMEIQDIKDDGWDTDINIGEGISDIHTWVKKTHEYVYGSCMQTGSIPCALMVFNKSDEMEINRTLRYLEKALPSMRL